MADALEQTKDLFSVDDFNEDDISTKSKIIKALDNPAFGEFRPKEEIIKKAKATGIGLLTGTLGIPSDAATLASAVSSGMAKYADSPTAMMLKDVLKKAENDVGRPAFDKWFTETTGLESNPENVDQLVGEVLSPTGAFLAPAKTLKTIFAPLKKGVTDFFDKMPPPDSGLATVNNAPVSSIEQTSKLLDKTKTTKPIETSAPIIPESEFVNAKPTINPIFAGEGTETGKKQAAKFRELEAENKYTPEELFLQTRVYRGDDGQLRWEISTADAKLKSSWEKSLNFEDEFLGITVPEKADGFYDGRASMQLSQILDFPTAYKEYYDVKGVPKYFDDVQTKTREIMSETQLSPLRNLQVYWERGDRYDNTLGYYTPNRDRITLNVRQLKAAARQTAEDYGLSFEEAFKLQVESTLLHEVQHAVQVREGFRMGGDSDNFLPENFDALVSTNKDKKDRILLDADDQFEVAIEEMAKKDPSYNNLAIRNKILNEVNADFNTLYDVLVHKKTNSIDKYKNKSVEELNSLYKQADERLNNKFSTFKDYIYSQDRDRMKLGLLKNAQENVKLKNLDKEATNKYYNLYGEREARLVQKRLEDRFKLNKLGGAEVAKEVESDTKFLSAKGDTDTRGRKLGQMGGFPADTKITPTKLMADGTTFHSSIIEFPQNPSKAKRKFDLEKTEARRAKARKLEDEQLKIQNMKVVEAHAPMVKLLGAEETTKIANNPPAFNADGTGFTENSLVFKNLSDRYTEEALSVVNPEITWIRIPKIYKQKPFQKYKDGDILRNAEGKTIKIELTSFLPVTDKKLYNNINVVNVSALGKNVNKKQYHVEPAYILGDGKYVRLTDLERVGYKRVGKPDLSIISDTKITPTNFNSTIKKIESNNNKLDNPVFKRISEITKLQDGPLGSRTPMDKDGLPKNLLRDKDGKPLILYYGDRGYEYKRGVNPKEVTKTPTDIPAKLKNKFRGANFLTYGSGSTTNATYTTPNPVFASSYALGSDRGSVIPIYVIGNKVTDIGNKNFMEIDTAGAKADRGEVIIGNSGQDYNFNKEVNQEIANAADKKYGTQQYVFKDGVQVFSAITGERLSDLPSINQNIRNKLLNLTQKEEDIALKNMSPEERIKYKAEKTYTEDLVDDTDFVEDMFKLDRKGDTELNERKRNLAKGGDMNKQMEMFEEGGLKQEGGTIDPVSGNDVPPGSTQEEVRDDIPAQLSEGEFVFPADVVRYIGLEKLMQLRQEAKQGLKQMEEMGQMGNSEEATMPDDLPFDETDLDIEDDLEYNRGGVVQAQAGTFVNPGTGVSYVPSQFAGQQLPSYQPPQTYQPPQVPGVTGGYRPTFYNQPEKKVTTPTYSDLIGSRPGQYDEFRTYKNESGFELQIPFKNGQPLYPIPEGYTFVDPEKVEAEDVATKQVTPQTTKVVDEGGDDQEEREKDEAMYGPGGGRINLGGEIKPGTTVKTGTLFGGKGTSSLTKGSTQFGVSYDIPGSSNPLFAPGALAIQAFQAGTGNLPGGGTGKFTKDGFTITKPAEVTNAIIKNPMGPEAEELMKQHNKLKETFYRLQETWSDELTNKEMRDMADTWAQTTVTKDNLISVENIGSETLDSFVSAVNSASKGKDGGFDSFKFSNLPSGIKDTYQEAVTQKEDEQQQYGTVGDTSIGLGTDTYDSSDEPSYDSGYDSSQDTSSEGSYEDDDMYNTGGLASKKQKKTKKMKRGGLASKK